MSYISTESYHLMGEEPTSTRTVDRLGDISLGRQMSQSTTSNDERTALRPKDRGADVELGPPPTNGASFMASFFYEVAVLKGQLNNIRKNVQVIEQLHATALTAISIEQGKHNGDQLDQLMDETQVLAGEIRNRLKAMSDENEVFFSKHGKVGSEARIRFNMHSTLARKFLSVMSEYHEVQTLYKAKIKEKCQRQIRIMDPNASAEDVDKAIESSGPVFAEKIFQPSKGVARNALADIQDRHKDILRLEASIAELHQLFLDMQVLVETQGDLIDQIQWSVQQSVAYTDKGVSELKIGREHSKSARKKLCMAFVCVVLVLAAVLIPLFKYLDLY